MRTKEQLERAKLSPFLESAFGQLLAELPKTRAGYELCKRIESRVIEHRKQIWRRKSRPSKGRSRSKKELADREEWFSNHVQGKTVYKATIHLDEAIEARDAAMASQSACRMPVEPVRHKTQSQIAAEMNQRMSDQITLEQAAMRGERWAIEELEEAE